MIAYTFDGLRLGAVRDFVTTPWAIINLADVADVAVGVAGNALALAARIPRLRVELARDWSSSRLMCEA